MKGLALGLLQSLGTFGYIIPIAIVLAGVRMMSPDAPQPDKPKVEKSCVYGRVAVCSPR